MTADLVHVNMIAFYIYKKTFIHYNDHFKQHFLRSNLYYNELQLCHIKQVLLQRINVVTNSKWPKILIYQLTKSIFCLSYVSYFRVRFTH
jgi:hypothetical protein